MNRVRSLVLFVALLGFWQLLSGRLDPLFVGLGVLSAAAITAMFSSLLTSTLGTTTPHGARAGLRRLWRLGAYTAWLFGRILPSGLMVARVVLDPRVPTRPGVFTFSTGLTSPVARAVLANSITLVPGTMTLDVDGDVFTVHAFTPEAAEDLRTGVMQRRVARVFLEELEITSPLVWEPATVRREDGS